jgi:hypothetical protein
MDPIHPINPVSRGIASVAPLTPTRRIDPKPRREPGRDPRREHDAEQPDDGSNSDEGETTPHVDVIA